MSNTAVTPLFPTGGRVRAWCVTKTLYKLNPSDPTPTTQEMFDSVNFVDGYNLRLDIGSVTQPNVFIPYKFSFITPMQSKNYQVFAQMMCNTNENMYQTVSVPFGYEPYKTMVVYDVPRFPKTNRSFWLTGLSLNGSSDDTIVNLIASNQSSATEKAFTLAVVVI